MKAFENAESLTSANLRRVGITFAAWEKQPDLKCNSNYHILCARVLGFTYPDYLRFCICNGAHLKGREGYCYPVFKDKKDAQKIAKLCNEYWKPYSKKLELGVG